MRLKEITARRKAYHLSHLVHTNLVRNGSQVMVSIIFLDREQGELPQRAPFSYAGINLQRFIFGFIMPDSYDLSSNKKVKDLGERNRILSHIRGEAE